MRSTAPLAAALAVAATLVTSPPARPDEAARLVQAALTGTDPAAAAADLARLGKAADPALTGLVKAAFDPATRANALDAIEVVLPEAFAPLRSWSGGNAPERHLAAFLANPRLAAILNPLLKDGLMACARHAGRDDKAASVPGPIHVLGVPAFDVWNEFAERAVRGDDDAFDLLAAVSLASRSRGIGVAGEFPPLGPPKYFRHVASAQPKYRERIARLAAPHLASPDDLVFHWTVATLSECKEQAAFALPELRKHRYRGRDATQKQTDEVLRSVAAAAARDKATGGKSVAELLPRLWVGTPDERRSARDRLIVLAPEAERLLVTETFAEDRLRLILAKLVPADRGRDAEGAKGYAVADRAMAGLYAALAAAPSLDPTSLAVARGSLSAYADTPATDAGGVAGLPDELLNRELAKVVRKHDPDAAGRDQLLDRVCSRHAKWLLARATDRDEEVLTALTRVIPLPGDRTPDRVLSEAGLLDEAIDTIPLMFEQDIASIEAMPRLIGQARLLDVFDLLPADAPVFRRALLDELAALQRAAGEKDFSGRGVNARAALTFLLLGELGRRPGERAAVAAALASPQTLAVLRGTASHLRLWASLRRSLAVVADDAARSALQAYAAAEAARPAEDRNNAAVEFVRAVTFDAPASAGGLTGVRVFNGKTYLTPEFFTARPAVERWRITSQDFKDGDPQNLVTRHTHVRRADGMRFEATYPPGDGVEVYEYRLDGTRLRNVHHTYSFVPPVRWAQFPPLLEFRDGSHFDTALEDMDRVQSVTVDEVDGPAGRVKALRVALKNSYSKTWFAPGYWVVRQEIRSIGRVNELITTGPLGP